MKKINSNVERDKKVDDQLRDDGWTVIRIWEHEIKKNPEKYIEIIMEKLQNSD
jgi:DNA mismatch endonuclease (patch repair protein)